MWVNTFQGTFYNMDCWIHIANMFSHIFQRYGVIHINEDLDRPLGYGINTFSPYLLPITSNLKKKECHENLSFISSSYILKALERISCRISVEGWLARFLEFLCSNTKCAWKKFSPWGVLILLKLELCLYALGKFFGHWNFRA